MKLISSCLVGVCATYKQSANEDNVFVDLLRKGEAIPVCPEQLGGLPTPRPPAEITGGDGSAVLDGVARVVTNTGADVTENYLRGANEVLRMAQTIGAEFVILKERSPSCGVSEIYDGTFSQRVIPGCGVTTALLRRNGFRVVSDEQFLLLSAPARSIEVESV